MARLKHRAGEIGLREFLLEWKVEFRELYGRYVDGGWDELTKPIDRLLGGEACLLRRYELPEDHPLSAPRGGDPCGLLVLTEDDVLVPYDEWRPRV